MPVLLAFVFSLSLHGCSSCGEEPPATGEGEGEGEGETPADGGGNQTGEGEGEGEGDAGPANTAPTVTLDAPAEGAVIRAGDTVSFQATGLDDEDGALTGASLAWSDDRGDAIGTGATVGNALTSLGAHIVTVTATDSGGLSAQASITLTVVDDLPPTAVITAPQDGASYSIGETITFTCAAADPDGTIANADIVWTLDATTPLGIGATVQNALTISGAHVVSCDVTDAAGNTATDTITVDIVANFAPVATISQPLDGAFIKTGTSIAFTATATDAEDGALSGASVQWLEAGVQFAVGLQATTVLPDGDHVVTVRATDADGAIGEDTITIHVVQNLPPVCTLDVSSAAVVAGQSVTFDTACVDPDGSGTIPNASYSVSSDLHGQIGIGQQVTQALLEIGTHVVTACAIDTTDAVIVGCTTTQIVVAANQAPTCAITQPASSTTIDADVPVFLQATVDDPEGMGVTISWVSSLSSELGTTNPLVRLMPQGGAHSITCVATDALGGTSTSTPVILTVNNPVARITGPVTTTFLEGDTVTLTGTGYAIGEGALASSSLTWTDGGATIGTGSPLALVLAPGIHDIVLLSQATSGAVGTSVPRRITVNLNQPPTVDLTSPTDGATFLACAAVPLRCDAVDPEARGTVTYAWTDELDVTLATTRNFNWTPSGGAHTARCTATDVDGKVGTAAVSFTVEQNSATIASPQDGDMFVPGGAIPLVGGGCSAPGTPITGASLTWFLDNTQVATGNVAQIPAGTTTAGVHVLALVASGAVGNPGTDAIQIIVNTAPTVTITAPTNRASFVEGATITFQATASDAEDGALTPTWTDSVHGALGTGASVQTSALLPGFHDVMASVTDSLGTTTTAQIRVVVQDPLGDLVATDIAGTAGFSRVNAILETSPGIFLLGTEGDGVFLADAVAGTSVRFDQNTGNTDLPGDQILDIEPQADGTYLIGTDNGFGRGCFIDEAQAPDALVCAGIYDVNNTLLETDRIQTVVELPGGRTLAGTDRCMLFSDWQLDQHQIYCGQTTNDGLPSDDVRDLVVAGAGVWIATADGGAAFMLPGASVTDRSQQSFTTFTADDGLADDAVRAIAVAPSGDVWFATPNGLSRLVDPFGAADFTTFDTADGMPSDSVRDVAIDLVLVNGSVHEIAWAATPGGLGRMDAGAPATMRVTTADGLSTNDVRTVVVDAAHVKWLGTANGLENYRGR